MYDAMIVLCMKKIERMDMGERSAVCQKRKWLTTICVVQWGTSHFIFLPSGNEKNAPDQI